MQLRNLLLTLLFFFSISTFSIGQISKRYKLPDIGNLATIPGGKSSILPLAKGGFALAFTEYGFPVASVGMARFDADANQISAYVYVDNCDVNSNFMYMSEKGDSTIYLGMNIGDCWAGYQEIFIAAIDTNGSIININGHHKAGFEDSHILSNIESDPLTGDYSVVATYWSQDETTGIYDYHIVHFNKYNTSGSLLFSNSIASDQNVGMPYNFNNSKTFYDSLGVVNEYLVTGTGSLYIYLMKLNSLGNLIWERKYDHPANSSIIEMAKINNCYYLLESEVVNTFIHKLDENGNSLIRLQIDSLISRKDISAMKVISGSRLLVTGAVGWGNRFPVIMELDTNLTILNAKYNSGAIALASEIIPDDESTLFSYRIPGDSALYIEKIYLNSSCSFTDTTLNQVINPYIIDSASFVHGTFLTNDTYTFTLSPRYFNSSQDCIGTGAENHSIVQPSVTIFPNPVTDLATIVYSNPDDEKMCMEITDIHGALIKKALIKGDRFELDVAHINPGLYIVSITGNNQSINRKLIVQK